MSTKKRLEALTADLLEPPVRARETAATDTVPSAVPAAQVAPVAPVAPTRSEAPAQVETRFPPALPGRPVAKTAPGQMFAMRGAMTAVEHELEELRKRLAQYADSAPARKLDPASVHPSRWANRHPASFDTKEFSALKSEIEHAGGNVQPILVRPDAQRAGTYEIVFGHRRHRACADLGLPVLAVVWSDPMSELDLFSAMDRENRSRTDLSAFEQGTMYQRALDEALFPSIRRLAEALGVSHTWVRKTLAVAQLPAPIVECFRSPLEVQPHHAESLKSGFEKDRRAILKRAEKIRGKSLAPSVVVNQLLGARSIDALESKHEIKVGERTVGRVTRAASGAISIRLSPGVVPEESMAGLLQAIARTLAE
ncbi:MAG: ParB/RepB/Spo0J family partition protein [Lautropia sp.]